MTPFIHQRPHSVQNLLLTNSFRTPPSTDVQNPPRVIVLSLLRQQLRRAREQQQQQQRRHATHRRPRRLGHNPDPPDWQKGVFWTLLLAFGGVFIIRGGRWALSELELRPLEMATRVDDRERLFAGDGDGFVVSPVESLALMAVAAAGCYAVTGFAFVRRVVGFRLVSVMIQP